MQITELSGRRSPAPSWLVKLGLPLLNCCILSWALSVEEISIKCELPSKESERGKWKSVYDHFINFLFVGLCVSGGRFRWELDAESNENGVEQLPTRQIDFSCRERRACHTQGPCAVRGTEWLSPDSRQSPIPRPDSRQTRPPHRWYANGLMANAGGENSALALAYHSTGDADRRQFAWRPRGSQNSLRMRQSPVAGLLVCK